MPTVALDPETEARLKELPSRQTSIWLGDRRLSRARLKRGPLAVAVWVDAATGAVRSLKPVEASGPAERSLLDSLVQAILTDQTPARPVRVAVPAEFVVKLKAALEPIEVRVDALQEPELLDLAFRDLEAYLGGSRRSYLKQPGITPGQVKKLFQSAAEFYQLAPWLDFSDQMLFELDGLSVSPVFCSVMGSQGIETGLSLLLDRKSVQAVTDGKQPGACIGLTFADLESYPRLLLREANTHGWPLAQEGSRQLAPLVLRADRPLAPFPTASEIRLLVDVVDTFAALYQDPAFPDKLTPGAGLTVSIQGRRPVAVSFSDLFR